MKIRLKVIKYMNIKRKQVAISHIISLCNIFPYKFISDFTRVFPKRDLFASLKN